MAKQFKRVHVIINPAAGANVPILNTLNDVFRKYDVDWDVSITYRENDAVHLAQKAIAANYDLIAAYGGDGTIMEVANGMVQSGVPLAILPGGTGNAMAFELNIPRRLDLAVELLCQDKHKIQPLDLGQVNDEMFFMLRLYTGVELNQKTTREMKDRFGLLAYAISTIQVLTQIQHSRYSLTIDGETVESEGIICLIKNAGSLGGLNLTLAPNISPSDGLLDIFILNDDTQSVISVASSILQLSDVEASLQHWQGQEIIIQSNPIQSIWLDGEPFGQTPCKVAVVPKAIEVVVPAQPQPVVSPQP